jgi:hypothetical protein
MQLSCFYLLSFFSAGIAFLFQHIPQFYVNVFWIVLSGWVLLDAYNILTENDNLKKQIREFPAKLNDIERFQARLLHLLCVHKEENDMLLRTYFSTRRIQAPHLCAPRRRKSESDVMNFY